jgi:hypothetical protein
MKKIQEAIIKNPFIDNTEDTIFTVLLRNVLNNELEIKPKRNRFIHGLIKYPQWGKDTDIFQYIKPKYLELLKSNQAYFIFDASTEGFSPLHDEPFFDLLYHNCNLYKIKPDQIIFVSSNLRDEQNIKTYTKENNLEPINVFSFVSFEQVLTIDDKNSLEDCEKHYNQSLENCFKNHQSSYFSALSRVNRPWRSYGQAVLNSSSIRNRALISHSKADENHLNFLQTTGLSTKTIKQFKKNLPLVVDRKDFKKNWAVMTPYRNIHDQTIFQLVNETHVEDFDSTSLFYSEKTFRPISLFQPFLIWGQRGANKFLKKLGYHTYDEWFDLSFDNEKDPITRYNKLLETLIETCRILDGLSKKDRIEWRFKNEIKLKHNFKTMAKSKYSYEKLKNFLNTI